MSGPAVDVQHLTHRYGRTLALDDLSWSADSAAITCVLGPNGAGKTTAMEIAEGLRRADGGSVRVLDADPWSASAEHRARVGVMLQDGGLPGSVGAGRFLDHVGRLVGRSDRVPALVDALDIGGFVQTTVRRLSGGQRQRVALAAALVGEPAVAFLDEPTAGLDPHARLDVWDLIRAERDRGCAVIVTTHSFEEAERLADKVVVMAAGRSVAEGPVATIADGGDLETAYFALTRPGHTR
ncbi:ABC transporter ATP-binding protein [Metallococcus carri]|uniref:ABC transporter ATP-binding protein n=1 Tax=Metallococcus carri TaxID=1656884 RepID=UPI002E2C7D86|nr:ABC transporter ATP-binding protein [Metallococcus carri]